MGRHRKTNRSILWDYMAILGWPMATVAGFFAGLVF